MKKLILVLVLVMLLASCEVTVEESTTQTTTVAETTMETTSGISDDIISDMPVEHVHIPMYDGISYHSYRYNDRYVVFIRYSTGVTNTGHYENISVLDLEKCEFIYDSAVDLEHDYLTTGYVDGNYALISNDYAIVIAEKNGAFSHTVTARDVYTYEYATSPDGKYAAYRTFDGEGNGTVNVKYPDGSVKQVLSDDRSGSLGSHRGYGPCEFIDNTRFVYWISGYEWMAGYGIYNVETGEKTEVLEGQYPYPFFDGGFFTTVEKDYIDWEIYKHDLSGNGTLIASREEVDGAFTLKSDCYYMFDGSLWLEFPGNAEYPLYSLNTEVTIYSADFEKELGKIVYPHRFDGSMFVYGEKIVVVQPGYTELSTEESKERAAKLLAEQIINHVIPYDFEMWDYAYSGHELFYFLVSLCMYDDNAEHPYNDMVSLSEDGMFYEISPEDADYINLHTFRISDWKSSEHYKELLDTNLGLLRVPNGIGIRRSSYACVDTNTRTENGQIIVEFNLMDGYSGFEDESHEDYGRFYFTFSADDLILLDFDRVTKPTKDTPYVISERGNWGSVVKYEFTSDGGMVVKYNNNTEEYYNSEGLHYKSMTYDENGKFTSKRFYTYDENGLIAKVEDYNADGELTSKKTYIDGKPLYFESSNYYKSLGFDDSYSEKWEYNEQGLLIRSSFFTTAEVRYTEGVTEYTYDEQGRLIREYEVNNEGDFGQEYTYDENGNMILTKRISYGRVFDYIICTYYPDGTLKTKQVLPDGYSYEIHLYEYLPNGTLWRVSEIWNPDIEAAGEYETVDTYLFYDDGRIKGATVEKYDLATGKYIKEHEASVSYSTDGRVRTDTHYHIDENGEMAFACEILLVYDEEGKLVSCETVRGERKLSYPFGNNENFFYYPMHYSYDEYGRVVYATRDGMMAESYEYMDCTPEQYELYQKVVGENG